MKINGLRLWAEVCRFPTSARFLLSDFQIDTGLGKVWLKPQSFVKMGDGLVKFPLACQGNSKVVVCLRVGVADLQSLVKIGYGVIKLSLFG